MLYCTITLYNCNCMLFVISHDMMLGRFSVTMEESRPGSDDKRASVNRHIQGSGQKRSCSVLRDCEAGGSVAHFDEHQHKRMRGVDHRAFQYLIEHKVTEGHTSDNPYVKEQRKASTTGRGMLCIMPKCVL